MLDEGAEASHQFFPWRQVFFQPHPGARPVVLVTAVGGSIGGRRRGSSAVYSGSLRLENRPYHGIAHDSKPLPSPSRIRLPTRALRSRQEKHRSGRPAARAASVGSLADDAATEHPPRRVRPHLRSTMRTTTLPNAWAPGFGFDMVRAWCACGTVFLLHSKDSARKNRSGRSNGERIERTNNGGQSW